jgi:hypothetical protein
MDQLSFTAKALNIYEQRTGFKPKTDREFYQRVGISPKRFGLLTKGELEITLKEALVLSDVFKIPFSDLLQ